MQMCGSVCILYICISADVSVTCVSVCVCVCLCLCVRVCVCVPVYMHVCVSEVLTSTQPVTSCFSGPPRVWMARLSLSPGRSSILPLPLTSWGSRPQTLRTHHHHPILEGAFIQSDLQWTQMHAIKEQVWVRDIGVSNPVPFKLAVKQDITT